MKITENAASASCRFWGYEPASKVGTYEGCRDHEERKAYRARHMADREAIKAAGHKANAMGLKNKGLAVMAARKVEDATGIEMHVFKHDYL